jgi:malonyl-CoA/methylmalonyl-CoA synthetase
MSSHFLDELRRSFETNAHRTALVYRERHVTYAELDSQARRAARWFEQLGVSPGDRIAIFTEQKLPLLVAHLGAMYAGGAPLPLNPRLTSTELRYFLSDSGSRLVLAGAEQRDLVEELRPELPELAAVVGDGEVLECGEGTWNEPNVRADDACLMIYSSGTTGFPKGVVHTHANAANGVRALTRCWHLMPDDRVLNVLPLFHIHGLAFATHATWLAGAAVHVEDAFDPARTLAALAHSTVFMAVPTIYYRLLDEPAFRTAAKSWTGMRLFTCGSAPIRPEVLPELEGILGHPIINRYGMSEAYVISSLPLEGPWPGGSVGLPLDGIEIDIVHEDGSSASPGEVGAVLIRGPNLFRRYWRNQAATEAAMATGWFDTGDLGTVDASGFLTLVGRKHDLVITSGFNVYPQVVERVINECPGVRESAVVGLPDKQRGERVAAAVVRNDPELDEARLQAWWDERLVSYQQPKTVLFVEALPRNSMGKVLRRELRKQFDQESG